MTLVDKVALAFGFVLEGLMLYESLYLCFIFVRLCRGRFHVTKKVNDGYVDKVL